MLNLSSPPRSVSWSVFRCRSTASPGSSLPPRSPSPTTPRPPSYATDDSDTLRPSRHSSNDQKGFMSLGPLALRPDRHPSKDKTATIVLGFSATWVVHHFIIWGIQKVSFLWKYFLGILGWYPQGISVDLLMVFFISCFVFLITNYFLIVSQVFGRGFFGGKIFLIFWLTVVERTRWI